MSGLERYQKRETIECETFPDVEDFKTSYGDPRGLQQRNASEESIKSLWNDLNEVGHTKAQGNLPLDTLIYMLGVKDVRALARSYEAKGLKTMYSTAMQPALYVWDEKMIQTMLDANRELLTSEGWPTDARGFIENVSSTTANSGPLYDFVAKTFNDPRYR